MRGTVMPLWHAFFLNLPALKSLLEFGSSCGRKSPHGFGQVSVHLNKPMANQYRRGSLATCC